MTSELFEESITIKPTNNKPLDNTKSDLDLFVEGGYQMLPLSPEMASEYWGVISNAIFAALPPTVEPTAQAQNNMLSRILSGQLTAWCLKKIDGDDKEIVAIATTTVGVEPNSGTRNLIVYTLYGFDAVPVKVYAQCIEFLKGHAKALRCVNIMAYSAQDAVVKIGQASNANTEFVVLKWEV